MKLKSLEKKIRRLEARLRAGPRKLARLKRKLDAMSAAKARKAQKKAAARAVARQTVQSLPATQKGNVKPVSAKKPVAVGKVKRKRNLSPERRAQLSAAMKARWAAKRAAEANPPSASVDQGSAQG
jgi:hypothetical protein